MTATTIPNTRSSSPHFLPRRFAAWAMAGLAVAGAVTAGVMVNDDDDATVKAPAVEQTSTIDKDAVRLQNSRSLAGPEAVDKDAVRLQNLQSITGTPTSGSTSGTPGLRYGPS